MKKFFIWIVALLIVGSIATFILYRFYLPDLVARAITREEVPTYVPRYIKAEITKYKLPVNRGAEDVIKSIHQSNVTLDDLFKAIDETEEKQIYAMLDELNSSKPKNTNEVFTVAKKHLSADFDLEILREPFNRNVNMRLIKKGMSYANAYRNEQAIDSKMAKVVAKKILLQKEKEFKNAMGYK